jgi:urease accessory protein
MKRASEVKVAGQWKAAEAVDRVVLDAGDRQREGGTTFLLDLPQATALRDGDGLVLDDSSIVRVGTATAVDPTRKALM